MLHVFPRQPITHVQLITKLAYAKLVEFNILVCWAPDFGYLGTLVDRCNQNDSG